MPSVHTCTRLVKVMMATVVNVSLLFHKLDPFVGLVVEYDRDWQKNTGKDLFLRQTFRVPDFWAL